MLELLIILFLISFIIGTTVYFSGNSDTKQKRDKILKDIDKDIQKQKRNKVRAGRK
jgi:hypothetical protein